MITSSSNPQIRELILLREKKSYRQESATFVVEGWRENIQAIRHHYEPLKVFYCESMRGFQHSEFLQLTRNPKTTAIPVSEKIFEKIAMRGARDGICTVFRARPCHISDLSPRQGGPWIVIEGAEKPGNIGAIFRSAESLGVGAIILCETDGDLYNPNLVRASLGAVFAVPCAVCSNQELIDSGRKDQRRFFVAAPESSKFMQGQKAKRLDQIDWLKPSAIVLGSEAEGVSTFWQRPEFAPVTIPMSGTVDSLNLSVSAALFMYEALRQKIVSTP